MNRLPERFSGRAATIEDLGLVADLVMQTDLSAYFEPETVRRDLTDEWREIDLENDSLLIFAPDESLVAIANLRRHGGLRADGFATVHPEFVGRGIGTALVEFIEGRAREDATGDVNLYLVSNATNERAARLLLREGYERVRRFWIMEKRLESEIPPSWPEGISVRDFVPGEEREIYQTRTETFEDHWHGEEEPESFETWSRHSLERYDHDPSLWFVAEDGEEISSICLCSARSTDTGWVDLLGVKRAWRGRGLGEALLRHAFCEFQRRGMKTVGLAVDSESLTGATRLYDRVGMEVSRESVLYRKVIGAKTRKSDEIDER